MKYLDLTLATPEENLACDEALLDQCENQVHHGLLRTWESPLHFVVLGYGNRSTLEIDPAACRRRGVPILRRCSGGGTVLQGPGSLNYSLVIPIDSVPELETITGANRLVMERNRALLASLFPAQRIQIQGHTDLTLADLKFSGNAQRRRRRSLLFHGTFLHGLDFDLVEKLLLPPPKQPDYRQHRPHHRFLINLKIDPEDLKAGLRQIWNAHHLFTDLPTAGIAALVREKYANADWNFKY